MGWTEFWSTLFKALEALLKPLAAYFVYEAGKAAEARRARAEALEKAAKVRDEYESIDHNRPDRAGLVRRMQRGEY